MDRRRVLPPGARCLGGGRGGGGWRRGGKNLQSSAGEEQALHAHLPGRGGLCATRVTARAAGAGAHCRRARCWAVAPQGQKKRRVQTKEDQIYGSFLENSGGRWLENCWEQACLENSGGRR